VHSAGCSDPRSALGASRAAGHDPPDRVTDMLRAAVAFLILAIVAALLGFTRIAGTSSYIAQVLFMMSLVLFVLGLLAGRRVRL